MTDSAALHERLRSAILGLDMRKASLRDMIEVLSAIRAEMIGSQIALVAAGANADFVESKLSTISILGKVEDVLERFEQSEGEIRAVMRRAANHRFQRAAGEVRFA